MNVITDASNTINRQMNEMYFSGLSGKLRILPTVISSFIYWGIAILVWTSVNSSVDWIAASLAVAIYVVATLRSYGNMLIKLNRAYKSRYGRDLFIW